MVDQASGIRNSTLGQEADGAAAILGLGFAGQPLARWSQQGLDHQGVAERGWGVAAQLGKDLFWRQLGVLEILGQVFQSYFSPQSGVQIGK